MEFDSEETTYKFYNEYTGKMGLSIRKEVVVKNKCTGEVTLRIFVCSKESFRLKDKRDSLPKHPRAETRIGCDARLSIKFNRCGNKFIVNHFEEVHNHALVTQDCTHMVPSQRKISTSQATELELAENSGIYIKNSYELIGKQAGGKESLGYIKQDIKNYLRSKKQRQLAFEEGGNHLQSDHHLVQVFKHFERVLNDKRYKELEAKYALCQKIPQVQRPIKMLIEAGKVYIKIIFEEFQDEFMSALEFYMKSTVDDGEDIVYTVVDVDTSKEFRVIWKKINNSLSCSCILFEMNGVLCGNAIKILIEVMNLKELPSEYILKKVDKKSKK
ncbi:hypothetical protein EZV62_019401 [Acer yangbiense]|uniref:FAR1 domain-containing protein n=1 Tax=Acer yangbiense TaxID=1000413 RepID=A0A5C7HC70_9ROSI|nr:hypothetical protein EZV62_019401 [Acer yangbiense]